MKRYKNYMLGITLIVAALCLPQTKASAICYACIVYHGCGIMSGSCSDLPPGTAASCEDYSAKFNPNTDYIRTKDGKAWVITAGGKEIQIFSDKFSAFLSGIKIRYRSVNKNDKKVQEQIEAEFKTFQKKDDGIVSARNLSLISIALGLKIRDAAKSYKG